jgi:hypothetical protein
MIILYLKLVSIVEIVKRKMEKFIVRKISLKM